MQQGDQVVATYGSSETPDEGTLASTPTLYMADTPLPFWYRDVWFAVLFGLQLLGTSLAAALCIWLTPYGVSILPDTSVSMVVIWLILTNVAASAFGIILVLALQQGSPAVVLISLTEATFCLLLFTLGYSKPWAYSWVLALILAILSLLWLLAVRRHLPFSSCMLETSASCLVHFPGAIGVTSAVLFLVTPYMVLWSLCFAVTFHVPHGWRILWAILSLLLMQWTTEALRNVVHLTTSGTFSLWYFAEDRPPDNPTQLSLQRVLSTSFGSVCCGSMLPAIFVPVHSALLSLQSSIESSKSCNMMTLLLDQLLHKMNPLMQHYNLYAFAHVALYGKPYLQAARDTWTLTMTCGLTQVFNNSLVGTLPLLFSLVGGAIIGGIVELITEQWFLFFLCALEGAIVIGIVLTTCTSVATTLCICYAENPDPLQSINLSLYSQINEAAVECAAAGLMPHHPTG